MNSDANTEPVILEVRGHIAVMMLNSPRTRNALTSDEQYSGIEEACRQIQGNREVRAVVVSGAGKAFCAGGDIKQMLERCKEVGRDPVEDRYLYKEGIHRIPLSLFSLEVPTIAAVNGSAIGAGLDLACMCDIRIAAEDAVFAESFVKLGIIPGDGGAFLLQRAIGFAKAAQMTFTGETINARTALEYGLVSSVVPLGQLIESALELAGRIAANPPHALRMAKRLMRESQYLRLESVLEMSAAFQALAHSTEDHRSRIRSAVQALSRDTPPKETT